MSLWTEMSLEMRFVVPRCGGVPRQDDLVRKWCETRVATDPAYQKMVNNPPGPGHNTTQSAVAVVEERIATIDPLPQDADENMKDKWVGFSRDEIGLFVRGANLRAHLKDCASVLGSKFSKRPELKDLRNFKHKLTDRLYIKEDRLYLCDDAGVLVLEPTEFRDATMSVMTAMGPRTCLKRVDMVFPCTLRATIQFMDGGEITRDHIELCLSYGCVHGFGQDRSLQFGRYEFDLGE